MSSVDTATSTSEPTVGSDSASTSSSTAAKPERVPYLYRHFLHHDANFRKLATREDRFHLHKTLGILAILSFVYRYGYVYNTTGSLGFTDGSPLDWATMAVHTMLALSSIIFRVPRKRIDSKPMVIYEEYRLHAMVFTVRCFSVYALATLFPEASRHPYLIPVAVMAHHLLADRITAVYGSGSTAVRATSTSGKVQISSFYKRVGLLYSLYQFLAIGSHILPSAFLADLGYNAIIAIQSSAFMMTLYRKRIIRGRTHMVVYSFCLAVSAFHMVRIMGMFSTALIVATFALRVSLPRQYSNKYALWSLFLFVHNVAVPAIFSPQPLIQALPTEISLGSEQMKGLATAVLVFGGLTMERRVNAENKFAAKPVE